MNKIISILFTFIILFNIVSIQACTVDANGNCKNESQCNTHLDCQNYGIYNECLAGQCKASPYKICRTDADCYGGPVGIKCNNYQCRA